MDIRGPAAGDYKRQNVGVEERSRIYYARNADVHIAYRVLGSGAVDMLWYPGAPLLPMESVDDEPHFRRLEQRLSSFARVVQFDARGIGLSDPMSPAEPPTLEQWVEDALCVLDSTGCGEVVVFAPRDSALQAVMLAASHPHRVAKLVIVNGFARLRRAEDYHVGIPDHILDAFVESNIEGSPGDEPGVPDDFLTVAAPTVANDPDFRVWWERAGRQGASPATAKAILTVGYAADVRSLLPSVSAPTLVLHRQDEPLFRIGHGKYLAEHIPDARFVELPGNDSLYWVGDIDLLLEEVEEFATGTRLARRPETAIATILVTDIVGSTETMAKVGQQSWRDVLDRHDAAVRRQLERFGGHEVKTTGDGFVSTFDGPARAVTCALAVRDAATQLGLEIRVGVHTGEVELRGGDISGMAVHIAARVEALARPGEVLVSRTVVDLIVGSGTEFNDRGEHELKGVPGSWRLFAVKG
ncbi:MAG TPA: adenylate/guanylate cyclase domain-containing protein [Acidimicrobiales bacterium]|nr:adenylate/guanylate cyclase domain-containing protein [Acidimicrobiales bacterium]